MNNSFIMSGNSLDGVDKLAIIDEHRQQLASLILIPVSLKQATGYLPGPQLTLQLDSFDTPTWATFADAANALLTNKPAGEI